MEKDFAKNMRENNLDSKASFLRDTFLDAEEEYLDELMKNPKLKEFAERINKRKSGRELALEALKRMSDIEEGKVKETELGFVEAEIVIICAAIKDYVRKREKERYMTDEDLER